MIKIPSEKGIRQSNKSDILGEINKSFNLDLTSNTNTFRVGRGLLVKASATKSSSADFAYNKQGVCGITQYNGLIYVLSGSTVWVGGNSPFDSYAKEVTSGVPTDCQTNRSDIITWNNAIYVGTLNGVKKFDGATWSTIVGSLGNSPRLMTYLTKRMFWVEDYYKLKSITTSSATPATTTGTIDLKMPGYCISFLDASNDNVWIGLTDTIGTGKGETFVYRWDGETQDTPTAVYKVNARGILSGIIKDGTPILVDTNGRLLQFNGGGFTEIDRFPLDSEEVWYNAGRNYNDRAIHPKGMVYDSVNDEILINITSMSDRSTADNPDFMELPSGVWAWNKQNGLYHKFSNSFTTPTGEVLDYGQYKCYEPSPMAIIYNEDPTASDGGRIVWGGGFYKGSTYDEDDDLFFGLFTNDTNDNKQKYGYFITSKFLGDIENTFNKVYMLFKKLLTSTSKLIVKYRTEEDTPTPAIITFTDWDRFTTATDISAYGVGDEVQILQGYGAGKSAHIKTIDGSTYMLDDTFPAGVIGQTGRAELSHWIKAGEINYSELKQWKGLTFSQKNTSPFIQLKVCMQFTGKEELYKLKIINNENIKE